VSKGASESVVEIAPENGAAVAFIFVTVLLDTLALGVIIPILPKLIENFVNNDTAAAARSLRAVRHRVGVDAVFLLADPRLAVAPVRPAAGGAVVEFRSSGGLCADGPGAVAGLAVRRPGNLGHDLVEHLDFPSPISPM
jgi:hypothetical protein